MFQDKYAKDVLDMCSLRMSDVTMDIVSKDHRKGEVLDYFVYPDGTRELVRDMDYNTIVDKCSVLLACLIKGESPYNVGAKYWAVGSGGIGWSTSSPPSPNTSDTQLATETFRKLINAGDMAFLDGSNNVSASPTNKLQISVTFLENEANGSLLEFGIFGANATGTANSGFMINHKTHPQIYKTSSIRLDRILRITF